MPNLQDEFLQMIEEEINRELPEWCSCALVRNEDGSITARYRTQMRSRESKRELVAIAEEILYGFGITEA